MTDQQPTPSPTKPWYKKWWIWVLVAFGVLVLVAALSPTPDEDTAGSAETTTTSDVFESTTTSVRETTTTEAPATTLPPILAEGSGHGDDVVELELPDAPVVIEMMHVGSANFAVWSLDDAFEEVDLLVNTIGDYDGTRPMQWDQDESVTGLEISADGDWNYEVRPLLLESEQSCRVDGVGDSVILLSDFADTGGAADLTHDGDENFAVWAWGTDGADLLVNEIGAYEGTVRVTSGLFAWDITANGNWSIDC